MQKLTKLNGKSRKIQNYCGKFEIPLLMAARASREKSTRQ